MNILVYTNGCINIDAVASLKLTKNVTCMKKYTRVPKQSAKTISAGRQSTCTFLLFVLVKDPGSSDSSSAIHYEDAVGGMIDDYQLQPANP